MEQMSEFIEKIEMLIRLKCLTPKKDDYGDEDCYIAAASQHEEVCEHLKKIPPVDFAPVVHGHWIYYYTGFYYIGVCSICGKQTGFAETNDGTPHGYPHCPHCGAIMDESEGSEND